MTTGTRGPEMSMYSGELPESPEEKYTSGNPIITIGIILFFILATIAVNG